jgi:hypothetical protein
MANKIRVYKGGELIAEESFLDVVSRVGDEKKVILELLKGDGFINLDNIFAERRATHEGIIMKPNTQRGIFKFKRKQD